MCDVLHCYLFSLCWDNLQNFSSLSKDVNTYISFSLICISKKSKGFVFYSTFFFLQYSDDPTRSIEKRLNRFSSKLKFEFLIDQFKSTWKKKLIWGKLSINVHLPFFFLSHIMMKNIHKAIRHRLLSLFSPSPSPSSPIRT